MPGDAELAFTVSATAWGSRTLTDHTFRFVGYSEAGLMFKGQFWLKDKIMNELQLHDSSAPNTPDSDDGYDPVLPNAG